MPALSMFYGVIIYMYFMDDQQHHEPHIHVRYQDDEAVVAIPSGRILGGSIPDPKMKLVQAWIVLHVDELIADWLLATTGQPLYKIDPLK